MDQTKMMYSLRGFSVFESGEKNPGTMEVYSTKGIISFEWKPEKCSNLYLISDKIEESQIFIYLHMLKKIVKTNNEDRSTTIRFILPDTRTNLHFIFPESEIVVCESMFSDLLSSHSITLVPNEPNSFNNNLEVELRYIVPENFILYSNIIYLYSYRTSLNKILDDTKEIDNNPIDLEQLQLKFDEQGHLLDYESLKKDIFVHGLTPEARPLAYLYLLGVFTPELTREENEKHLDDLHDEYMNTFNRWENKIPGQEVYLTKVFGVIVSDVKRTDKKEEMFQTEGPARRTLEEILMIYSLLVADVGYIQGMSDIAAGLMEMFFKKVTKKKITLYDDKVVDFHRGNNLIFWLFYGLLKLTGNDQLFKCMDGNRDFLETRIFSIIQTNIPPVAKWLVSVQNENMLFTFSATLLLFKRWFSINNLGIIWDRLITHRDPIIYLRFLISSCVTVAFQYLCLQGTNGGDVSSGFNKVLALIEPKMVLRIANAFFNKIDNDPMHSQWIFMKYPEDPPEIEYVPKYIKIY